MSEQLYPTFNNVVLELVAEVEATDESQEKRIIVPDTIKKQENIATVVSRGEDIKLMLTKGTKVVYRPHSGLKVKLDNKEYLIVPVEAILAVVDNE